VVHAEELADLLRWCTALGPEPAELAAEVVVSAGWRWPDLANSPEELRGLTVQTFLRRRPSPPRGGRADEQLSPELRPVVAALDSLPALTRAVIMLSCLERLTRTEIAGIVDRPVSTVSREFERSLVTLGGDPYAVAATLRVLTWEPPDPLTVTRAVRRVGRQRARRRGWVRVVAVAAATGLIAAVTLSVTNRPAVEARPQGVWAFTSTVRPLPGWEVRRRVIGRDWEITFLRADTAASGRCSIAVGRAGTGDMMQIPDDATQVRISGRPGFYTARGLHDEPGPALAWRYADDAWTVVACTGVSEPERFLPTLARHVRFKTEPVLMPYRLVAPPRHYVVSSVAVGLVRDSTTIRLSRNDYPEGTLMITINYPASRPLYGVRFERTGISRYSYEGHAGVCKPFGQSHLCVRAEQPRGALGRSGAWHPSDFTQLDRIVNNLVVASSATDQTTWFDARDALDRG
jgi:hypothetical protein